MTNDREGIIELPNNKGKIDTLMIEVRDAAIIIRFLDVGQDS